MDNQIFCLDCESIGTNTRQCDCGSRALYPIRAWIERKPVLEDDLETGCQRFQREESARREKEVGELERMFG